MGKLAHFAKKQCHKTLAVSENLYFASIYQFSLDSQKVLKQRRSVVMDICCL
jgi:hypothetical protein